MPYEIVWEEKGVNLIYTGDLTGTDLIAGNIDVYKHPDFNSIEYQIIDLLGIEKYPIEAQAIRRVAELDAVAYESNPKIKTVIVANRQVAIGLTNMYKVHFEIAGKNGSWETELFESLDDARKWLKA